MASVSTFGVVQNPAPVLLQSRSQYTLGIVCALRVQADAIYAALDYEVAPESQVEKSVDDDNTYKFESISQHHVVVAQLGVGKSRQLVLPKT